MKIFFVIPVRFTLLIAILIFPFLGFIFPDEISSNPRNPENRGDGRKEAILDKTFRAIDLGEYSEYFEDKEGKLGLDEIRSQKINWKIPSDRKINFGFSTSWYWVKFSLKNPQEKEMSPVFDITFPRQDYIEFYSPQPDGTFAKKVTGDTFPFSEREIEHISFAYNLELLPKESRTYYIRTRSLFNRSILNPMIFSREEFTVSSSSRGTINGMFYGLLGIMFFYNLFLYFTIRDRAYILLTVSIALFGVFLAGVHGTAYQYLYPDFPWIQNRDYTIFSPAIMISMLLFTVDYLELRKNNPAIYKYVKFWILFLGSTMIAFPFLIGNYPALIFQSISGAGLLFTLFQISIGAYLSFKRYRPAYFYMLSFSLFFLSLIIGILTVLSVFPPSPVTALSFQVGFALILILLSIGLADKINILKNSLREANELLEQKVTERTSELSSALSVIHYDLQTAQKIQVNILPGKLEGIGELDIAVKYIPMNKVGGDIYDVTNLQNGKIRVFLADATGHGVQAALMTMSIHSEYQHIKDYQLQPGEILSILNNEYFHRYALLNTYFTCILIDIDIQNDRVIYSSAGHPEQICLVSGKASRFRCSGKLMGVLKDSVYKSEEFDFGKGDRLVLFTDGIFEEFHPNDGEFGEERLFNAIDLQKIIPVKEFSESIIKEVSDFLSGHEQQDDITLLVIERK